MVDPAERESTFPAPAAFNTDMLLFERFADYLLFINYRRHGKGINETTVHYECNVTYDEQTHIPMKVFMKITDQVSGFTFSQTFTNPVDRHNKPSAQLFRNCIHIMKDMVNGRLETKPVENEHTSVGEGVLNAYSKTFIKTVADPATPMKPKFIPKL
jgi:hypothetical protein